jgi:F-type H+-transporting ATPase subunit b
VAGAALANDGGHASGGLPQLNPANFPSQLFWLVVSFITLYFMLFGVALPRVEQVMQARDGRISWDISKADELRNESNALLANVDRLLDRTRAQAQEIVTRTSGEGQAAAKMLMARFESDIERRTRESEQRVLSAKNKALAELGQSAVEITQDLSQRLAGVSIEPSRVAAAVEASIKERN